ncbi:MAG TPA: NUDIX domain-containing protein [Longimicrobiales bacterium]
MERLKRSVSMAIHNHGRVLIVQRPADDEDLPDAWGLPAASLRENESWQDAVERAGRDKLGVELRVGRELAHGTLERARYTLEMKLFEADIVSGAPLVPQPDASVTQYQAWKWGGAEDLQPAARQGSLCCQLYLRTG